MSIHGPDREHAKPGADGAERAALAASPGRSRRARSLACRGLRLVANANLGKIAIIVLSLVLFILSLQLIKAGAASAGPLVRDTFSVTHPLNALGFGWLLAYAALSGSPVAAIALVLLSENAISDAESFMMIGGSRLGSGMVVLLLGFYYVLRGSDRQSSLSVGLLSLTVSATVQVPALALGYVALRAGALSDIQFSFRLIDLLDQLYEPVVTALADRLPDLAVMGIGIILIVVTFNLFDRGLPEVELGERGFGETPVLIYRPSIMFMLGVIVTLLTLSVTVSVGILVPLTARGLIRRENLIPYIMGSNVSTLIDTLLVAVLLDSSEGFTVVLIGMIAITIVSMLTLLFILQPYERAVVELVNWSLVSGRNLAIVLAVLLMVPIVLVLL